MQRTFCDVCNEEIKPGQPNRVLNVSTKPHNGQAFLKIQTQVFPGETTADVCMYCLIDAVKKADNRPQAPARLRRDTVEPAPRYAESG